jgi:hypothetical protein
MMAAALRNVPQDPGDLREFQDGNMRSMEQGFRATPGISHLMTAYEKSFEWMHGYAPPVNAATLPNDPAVRSAAQTVQGYAGRDDLPTRERLDDLRGAAAGLREEIATLQAEMDAIGAPADAYDVVGPAFQQAQSQMSARVSDLAAVEQQLAEDEAQAGSLTVALQVLSGTVVAPEISTESIDQALGKVQQLAAQLQSVPSASTGQSSGLGAVQERATGGVFGARPLLVGERGPELYFPNRSGFIATNQQTQRLQRGAQRVRSASMAALAASSLVGVPSALAAGDAPSAKPTTTHVEIGSISITAPSGVSDPEALVALIEARVGERLSATIAASYSD